MQIRPTPSSPSLSFIPALGVWLALFAISVLAAMGRAAVVVGAATEVAMNVTGSDGNVYDYVFLTGATASVSADAGQVVRVTFLDPDDDLVNVEFSGKGSLTVSLENASGPAAALKYNQAFSYVKGRSALVIQGHDSTSNLSVYSVGRANTTDQSWFRNDVVYDGVADLGRVLIVAPSTSRFGWVRAGNARFSAAQGVAGISASGVEFVGPIYLGDIDASGAAVPTLSFGSTGEVRIVGGDMFQTNGSPVQASGFTQLQFVAGANSHGVAMPAQTNRGQLQFPAASQGPAVTVPPRSRAVVAGSPVSFQVAASGTPPLSYEWKHDGATLPGETSATLTLPAVTLADRGRFEVVVRNGSGTAKAITYLVVEPPGAGVVAWGYNAAGQSSVPDLPSGVLAVAGGDQHTIALKADGTVAVFGANFAGQRDIPSGLAGVVAVSAGGSHNLALKSDGSVVAWGANSHGQATVPTGLVDVVAIAGGSQHSVAQRADGTVVVWGGNANGELNIPSGLSDVVAVASGGAHTLALKGDRTLVAWGYNYNGQSTIPAGLPAIHRISSNGAYNLVSPADGTLRAWGWNDDGQTDLPANLGSVKTFSAGGLHALAIRSDGVLVAWGSNWFLQRDVPAGVRVGATSIAGGGSHSLAIIAGVAPVVTVPLAFKEVAPGSAATLSANVGGPQPISYAWRKDGIAISGATTATLTIPSVQAADLGVYELTATNGFGSTASTARLAFNSAPVITASPQSQTVAASVGASLTLTVTATGTAPLTYEWFKDGSRISNPNQPSYSITSVEPSASGVYVVKVSNEFGSATSTPATITATVPTVYVVRGTIGQNITWTKNITYVLDGRVYVGQFRTLTIEAGTVIKARARAPGDPSMLIVPSDSVLVVKGTATQPVVFTAESDDLAGNLGASDRGLWGGIVVVGAQPINVAGGSAVVPGLPDDWRHRYGAPAAGAVLSLSVNYASVRHAGAALGSLPSTPAILAAGASCRLDHVEVFASAGDGMRVLGGGAWAGWQIQYLASVFNSGAGFSYSEGYSGAAHHLFVLQDATAESPGIVAEGGSTPEVGTPYARPFLANITAIGAGATSGRAINSGIVFRRNAGGRICNSVFHDFGGAAVRVESDSDKTEDSAKRLAAGDLAFLGDVFGRFGAGDTAATLFQSPNVAPGGPVPAINYTAAHINQTDQANIVSPEIGLRAVGRVPNHRLRPTLTPTSPARTAGIVLKPGTPNQVLFSTFNVAPTTYAGAFLDENWLEGWTKLSRDGYLGDAAGVQVVTSPASQVVALGSELKLWVEAEGEAPITYAWSFNGVPIADATSSVLRRPNVTTSSAGRYTVVVSNPRGSDTSAVADVKVVDARIANVTGRLVTGASTELSFVGPAASTYQWRLGGSPIAGATGSNLALSDLSFAHSGAYDLVATYPEGELVVPGTTINVEPPHYPEVVSADPAFAPSVETKGGYPGGFLRLADGGALVFGAFSRINGTAIRNVARLTSSGLIDPTFVGPNIAGGIYAAVVQTDGKIVIGGDFTLVAGQVRTGLARLNVNGTLDASFTPTGNFVGTYALGIQGDGKVVVGGAFAGCLARLSDGGAIDPSFVPGPNGTINALAIYPDGRIAVGGAFTQLAGADRNRLARLGADGTLDASFNVGTGCDAEVAALQLVGPNQLLVVGAFTRYNGATVGRIVRLSATGAVDSGWIAGSGFNATVYSIAVQPDGRILVGGLFGGFNGVGRRAFARLLSSGELDTSFVPANVDWAIIAIGSLGDGSVLIGGGFPDVGGTPQLSIARLSADGRNLMGSFAPGLWSVGKVNRVVATTGGRVVAGGLWKYVNNAESEGLIRVHADGTADTRAGGFPFGGVFGEVNDIHKQPDGKLIVAGASSSPASGKLVRVTDDGLVDPTFVLPGAGISGTPTRVYPYLNGRYLVMGNTIAGHAGTVRNHLLVVNSNGTLDPSFDAGVAAEDGAVLQAVVQPQGRIVVVGSFTKFGGSSRGRLVRLLPTGAVDSSFGAEANGTVNAIVPQVDGALIIAGDFTTVNGTARARIARLDANGALDTTFNPDFALNAPVKLLHLQPDGRLYVAGSFTSVSNAPSVRYLLRTLPDGALDSTFVAPGLSAAPRDLLLLESGELLLAGGDLQLGETARAGLLRTRSTPGPLLQVPPTGGSYLAGTPFTLQATVVGGKSVSYQWLKDGTPISGATRSSFTVVAAQSGDGATYSLRISHSGGSFVSAGSTITIVPSGPLLGPAGAAIAGYGAALKAGSRWPLIAPGLAAGSTPISYQWSKDGTPIIGATSRTFFPTPWQATDSGTYTVRLSNHAGSVASSPFVQLVTTADDWHWRLPNPQGNSLSEVAFLNGRFLAGGARGTIVTSTDGSVWTATRLGVTNTVFGFAFGNGRYVALSGFSGVWRSLDAAAWTPHDCGVGSDGNHLTGIAFGAGRFVAVGDGGIVVYSSDGDTWKPADLGSAEALGAITFGAGKFIVFGAGGHTFTSLDGITWSAGAALPYAVDSADFGAGRFAAVAGNHVLLSADGATWTDIALATPASVYSLKYSEAGFLAVSNAPQGRLWRSVDGVSWTELNMQSAPKAVPNAIAYGNGRYVLVSPAPDVLATSQSGTWWSRFAHQTPLNFVAAATNGNEVVAVASQFSAKIAADHTVTVWPSPSQSIEIYTPMDDDTWVSRIFSNPTDVAYGAGRYIAVGADAKVATSTDGLAWSTRLLEGGPSLLGIAYVAGRFIAVGAAGKLLSSPDGAVWNAITVPTTENLLKVAFGAGTFVAVGAKGTVLTSSNGISWATRTIDGITTTINDVVFASGQFVLGTEGGSICTSGNGVTWTARSNPIGLGIVSLAYSGAKFFALTRGSTHYLSSNDGITWTVAQHGNANANADLVSTTDDVFLVGASASIVTLHPRPVAPSITSPPVGATIVAGQSAAFSVTATGLPAPTYQWRRNGLNIAGATSSTLALDRVPLDGGGQITVVVTNKAGVAVSTPVALRVDPLAPAIAPMSGVVGIVGAPLVFQVNAGTAQAAFSAAGLVGSGLAIDSSTGLVSGVPTAAGALSFAITATNAAGSDTETLTITIKAPPPVVTSAATATGRVGVPFSYTITATNNPASYAILALPPGLSFNTATGVLSGTPTEAATTATSVKATNAGGTGLNPLLITIEPTENSPRYTGPITATGGVELSGIQGDTFAFLPAFANGVTGFVAANLPPGIVIDAATGELTGRPTSAGVFAVVITAANAAGSTALPVRITVNSHAAAPVITSAGSATAAAGSPFSFTLAANPPTGVSFSANGLPASLGLNSATGVISGTVPSAATVVARVRAANVAGSGPEAVLVITVNPAVNSPLITSGPVVRGRAGTSLTFNLSATHSPASFAVTNGTLPSGLTLTGSPGTISGTPALPGLTRVWIAATNTNGTGHAFEVLFDIAPALLAPVIIGNSTASGQVGRPFRYVIAATNAPTAYAAAPLPEGLSLVDGVISGIPLAPTVSSLPIVLKAGNHSGWSAPRALSLTIAPADGTPVVTEGTLPAGRVGEPYNHRLSATGNPNTYSADGLPAGLALDSATGDISGSPVVAGRFELSVRAMNASGAGNAVALVLQVARATSAPAITSAVAASGRVGQNFTYAITAAPGAVTGFGLDGDLPDGLAFNSSTGVLNGKPVESGLFRVRITATSAAGTSAPETLVLNIAPPDNAPIVTSAGTAYAVVGEPFTYRIVASAVPVFPAAPFAPPFLLDAVNLPEGLAVDPATGVIQGRPAAAGTFVASVFGINSAGTGPLRDLHLVVHPASSAPEVSSPSVAAARVGVSFTYQVAATNGPTAYEVLDAPAWLAIDHLTGLLVGIPVVPGGMRVRVVAANSAGRSSPFIITLSIAPALGTPVITSSRSASGLVGTALTYRAQASPEASGFVASGLPAGLSLARATGVITGTPTASGRFEVALSAENANGAGAPITLVFIIQPSLQLVVPGT